MVGGRFVQQHPQGVATLSPREREALRLFFEGHSRKSAGRVMGCSPRTIETYWKHARLKLDAPKTILAARMLIEAEAAS